MTSNLQFDTKLIQSIDFWVANFKQEDFSQSTPLLIAGPAGSGKSSLISKWLTYHREYNSKDNNLIIYENPGLSSCPSFSQTLFNILDSLRKEYELNLKLSVKEERLRTQFSKLFETSHSLPMPKKTRKCVVIIFDGVDQYKISNGREDTAEWLPVVIPENIRLIYTCRENSEAFRFLSPLCKVLKVPELRRKYRFRVLNDWTSKWPELLKSSNLEEFQICLRENQSTSNPLFMKLLLFWSLSSFPKTTKFVIPTYKEIANVESLFIYATRFFASSCSQKIKKVLSVLKLCKNNLSKEEIALSSGVSLKLTSKVLTIFDCCLIKQEEFYCFSNSIFRDCLEIECPEVLAREISLVLEEKNSFFRVNELLNALKVSKDWKRLKDRVRSIHVFINMFNTRQKIELCSLWQDLEKNGFDPVEEYNKSIEDFISNHPLLKPEEIVNLVINFFCFFDDYGLLESPKSVNFRNYPLIHQESLEQVNLFQEAEKISAVFNKSPESPLFDNELRMFQESSRNELREIVVKMNLDNSKKNSVISAEFYHYKRWFWIQFPLIALSANVNPSALLASLRGSVGVPQDVEQGIFESLLKIIDPSPGKGLSRPNTTKPLLSRGNSLQMIRTNFGIKRKISQAEVIQDSQTVNKSFISSFSQSTLPDARPETYSINFSLKDTGINTVLLKLNSQLVRFSEAELKKKFKETQKLQQQFNKLREIHAFKVKEIENIATQIGLLKAKSLEKEEVLQKFANLQYQSNKSLEKVVLAQAEVDFLQKIVESCEKNPPFIKEWNNDMIKAIDVCSSFIRSESLCIEQYEKDTFVYLGKYNELKSAINEKRSAGTSTLTKLSEKYSLNAFINKSIVHGFNRRKLLLMTPEV
jgi:transcription initiation factor TFIIIB Brf1 subunit/transcription initiation factor TFIIB